MSTQYRGPLPDEVFIAGVDQRAQPTAEWIAAHPDAKTTGEKPGDEDTEVMLMLTVQRLEPSALFPGEPHRWPHSEVVALGPILFLQEDGRAVPARGPLSAFRALTPIKGSVAKRSDSPIDEDAVSAAESATKEVEPS
jgi:hypothetical protein